ncbi:MAG TPA: cytochrome C oxidase subunit IV family protein [Acidobacteriota bacterium]|jgi:cytochrome c oxidase subunit 4|nr:cytochrome C oxidase subunit IV family protein [Acidobacteriota bacterium]
MSGESAEDIRKHVRVYLIVFAALAALTVITVGISYLHLPTHWAILFALLVATIKGSLVACYFMHLISERKVIYWILIICAFFFAFLIWAPVSTSPM